jgi:hypothetical protein
MIVENIIIYFIYINNNLTYQVYHYRGGLLSQLKQ